MSKKNASKKPKYESPTVVPLGELAQGSGYCRAGSHPSTGDCTGGIMALSYCTDAGVNAGTACTAGPAAPTDCTAGTVH